MVLYKIVEPVFRPHGTAGELPGDRRLQLKRPDTVKEQHSQGLILVIGPLLIRGMETVQECLRGVQ